MRKNIILSKNKGFTLIELMITSIIIIIVFLGFYNFIITTIQQTVSYQKMQTANSILLDVAERISKLPINHLLLTSYNTTALGIDTNGNLLICINKNPTTPIQKYPNGTTEFTMPLNNGLLYMYDNNIGSFNGATYINNQANINISHPKNTDNINDLSNIVTPIRNENNATYYIVWSIVNTPCNNNNNLLKLFITVYWIEPEPNDTTITDVERRLLENTYKLKNISLTIDKSNTI